MALNTQQAALFSKLRGGVYSIDTLSAEEVATLSSTLRPLGPFTQAQRDLMDGWYLLVTPGQLDAAEALLPPYLGLSAIQALDGRILFHADLLTDFIRPSDTWHSLAAILSTLPLVFVSPGEFPPPTGM